MPAKKRANRSRPAKRSKAVRRAKPRRRPVRLAARARRKAVKPARSKRAASRKPAVRAKARRIVKAPKAAPKPAPRAAKPVTKAKARPARPAPALTASKSALLERERRRLPDVERNEPPAVHADSRTISAARSGHDELKAELARHTQTSPKLTAGDIDAKWQDADSIGDEAPGGDNPTPDQDRVDDIGKALGVQYQDDQELEGGDEIRTRDEHRWELDPASSDDWPHEDK
jgi:hypothetical protein